MKTKLLFFLIFSSVISFANMANPWSDGARHSLLYTVDNCIVEYEIINIDLFPHYANYNINYSIYSDKDITIPLVFIGIGLKDDKNILVNDTSVSIIPLTGDLSKFTFLEKHNDRRVRIKYGEDYSLGVALKDLIYFKANLKKGTNTITVNYQGGLEENRLGFVSKSKLEYSLYPSKFWKSFGSIEVNVNLGDTYEVTRSNIGEPILKNNSATWEINNIENDIKIEFIEKTSILSRVLIAIDPLGIGFLIFLMAAYKNYKIVKRKTIAKDENYKYYLPLSVLALTILFYMVWFFSFDLIDFSLGKKQTQHSYYFLFFFTSPIFLLIYGAIMTIISKSLKKKYN